MDNKRELSFKRASFMKVIEDEFTKKLQIPQAFTKIFEERVPPWLILEIAGTRKCWRVDIEEDGNGGLFLSCGFDCFAKANSLEVGNFLLFELEEPSILQVKIYEKDGSEKTTVAGTTTFEYEVGPFESKRQTPIVHQEGEASPWPTMPPSVQYGVYEKKQNITDWIKRKRGIVSDTKHGLRFSLIWRKAKHFTYYLTIPKAMVRGKTFSDKDAVVLQDREGKNWRVELKLRPDGRLDFAQGWRDFVKDNELRTGDTLVFEFVSNNVIQVHVGRTSQLDHNPYQREQDCKLEPTERNNMACENDQELPANCTINNNAPVMVGKYEPVTFGSQSPSFSFTWKQKTKNNSYLTSSLDGCSTFRKQ
ncbi:B3 domain-containing protein REM-like 1 isoform X3 [Spinacia oleracea]|uniref:B3 domain-containing protein REM-like 1 isoform X3 n=1 Tax=Spinacia oleracea TaxID=3562 RepID=A0ABM3R6U6_SPIOL|nr:B3 domain-containing protein REM-like 1 isoform X3 [Spinacia oleracea]